MKKNILCVCLSAVLLVLAYPNFNFPFLIWIGLVPFFFLLDNKSPKAAFLWGWLTGFLFFLGTHYWLIHVTLPGMVLVNIYLGVYFGLFGLGYAFFQKLPLKHQLWLLPSIWVICEFARDRFLTGFGWACLGHSQYQVLPLIQIADITGVFGVSFLVVMVNLLLKELLSALKSRSVSVGQGTALLSICIIFIVFIIFAARFFTFYFIEFVDAVLYQISFLPITLGIVVKSTYYPSIDHDRPLHVLAILVLVLAFFLIHSLLRRIVPLLFKHAKKQSEQYAIFAGIIFMVSLISAVCIYGTFKIGHYNIANIGSHGWLTVIQPNIPQSRKWDPDSWEVTQNKLMRLTEVGNKESHSHFVIWPETSFPGYMWQSPERYAELKRFVEKNGITLLFGAVTMREGNYYNSAIMLKSSGTLYANSQTDKKHEMFYKQYPPADGNAEAREVGRYDKMHLVPFGEFLPLRPLTNFIENFVPIGDFERGKDLTLFSEPNQYDKVAVLICFEDTVAPVVRSFTKAGATTLVNITNDGWFKDTNAPFLHLQGSVFQAVANRRNMIRSANTGISGSIAPVGELNLLADQKGKMVMVEGYKMAVPHRGTGELSFYTRFGDVFAYFCFFAVGVALIKRKILL
jgi:apolipoprotein N-acyltransferase